MINTNITKSINNKRFCSFLYFTLENILSQIFLNIFKAGKKVKYEIKTQENKLKEKSIPSINLYINDITNIIVVS